MTSTPADRFRRLLESTAGTLSDREVDAVADGIGLDLTDPEAVAEFEKLWQSIEPAMYSTDLIEGWPFLEVEPVFQRIIERNPGAFDPGVLASRPAGERMIIATRAIEGQVDNGGWPAVFYNMADGLLPAAIEGYRLLGLDDHAALAERIRAHGWIEPSEDSPDDPAWDAFDVEWFALPDAEEVRARYIADNPTEFSH